MSNGCFWRWALFLLRDTKRDSPDLRVGRGRLHCRAQAKTKHQTGTLLRFFMGRNECALCRREWVHLEIRLPAAMSGKNHHIQLASTSLSKI